MNFAPAKVPQKVDHIFFAAAAAVHDRSKIFAWQIAKVFAIVLVFTSSHYYFLSDLIFPLSLIPRNDEANRP